MSETTFPFKKAVPIIIVAWILSLFTTLAFVYLIPNIFPPSWHTLQIYSGVSSDRTNVFYVSSDFWSLDWGATADIPETAAFVFYVYPEDATIGGYIQSIQVTPFDFEEFHMQGGFEYLIGSGAFYIEIDVARDLELWFIRVRSYH